MLHLRPIEPDDAPGLREVLSDPEVAVWLRPRGKSGPFSLQECKALARRDVAHWTAHGFGAWLAWDGDACVGRALLKHSTVGGRGEVEIGWMVGRRHWGTGIGTALGRHVLHSASEHGITNVIAFTREDNLASRRVMEKLGMGFERPFEHAGWAHVLYRSDGGSPERCGVRFGMRYQVPSPADPRRKSM